MAALLLFAMTWGLRWNNIIVGLAANALFFVVVD